MQSIDGVNMEFKEEGTKVLVGVAEAGPNDLQVWTVLSVHQTVVALFMPACIWCMVHAIVYRSN